MTKKILVTGGAGFIGSNLCRRLWEEGNEIFCLDNLCTGQMRHIDDLTGEERFTFLYGDVTDPLDIQVDEIYNLACPASPVHYQKDPIKTLKTCVIGALNMLELANQNGAKILQTSTSEVYGEPLEHPQKETYRGNVNPIGVRSCYDEGKRAAETLFFDAYRTYGTKIRVVRIFNTYGPNMDPKDGRVVSNFILQALRGEPITLYGDGRQTRSFCYVSDTVGALIRMMAQNETPGPINIGNPVEITVREIAERILAMTESTSGITYRKLPSDDPTRRRPDISRAKSVLGWEPKVQLEEGLEKTIAYFRKLV